MCKKPERGKQNSVLGGQNIDLCESDCAEAVGVSREVSEEHCADAEPNGAEVPSGRSAKKKDRSKVFSLSFYDNSDMDAIAQKAYKSDMSDEELKRSRKRDWAYIFIGVPLLIGVIYLIALIIKLIK